MGIDFFEAMRKKNLNKLYNQKTRKCKRLDVSKIKQKEIRIGPLTFATNNCQATRRNRIISDLFFYNKYLVEIQIQGMIKYKIILRKKKIKH